MTKQKLSITPGLSGYEFIIKDITGFGTEGYSTDSLNVNNVHAVVLVLKDSSSKIHSTLRLEGPAKNDFMVGLQEVVLTSEETERGFVEISPDLFTVESYLITKVVDVKGLANYSEITGTDLDVALGDNFVIDGTQVYEVIPGYTNGGTVLQLNNPIKKFFNKGSFGKSFEFKVAHYVKALKVLYKMSVLDNNTIQKDGQSENYMVLTGHVNVVKWKEEAGDTEDLYLTLRDIKVLTNWLNNIYFK